MTALRGRPLQGRRVLVTRARAQAGELAALLAARGAEPVILPLIAPVPLADTHTLDGCIARLARGSYRWLIFSSANGVRFFVQRVRALGYETAICQQARIVAGPATATALAQHGLRADVVLADFRAETVVARLTEAPLADQRVLLPRAAGGRRLLPDELRRQGAVVDEVVLYRSAPVPASSAQLARWLRSGILDAITFTSGSTVRHFIAALGRLRRLSDWEQGNTLIACIGPATAATAQAHGLRVDAIPEQPTGAALVGALADALAHRGRAPAVAPRVAVPRIVVTKDA